MNKPRITVFSNCPPTCRQSRLILGLRKFGIEPLLDSVHKDKGWFVHQFSDSVHKVFYTDPYVLHGNIEDVDFDIMGTFPELVICYPPDSLEPQFQDWENVSVFLSHIMTDCEMDPAVLESVQDMLLIELQQPLSNTDESDTEDDLVVQIDARDYYYSYEYKIIEDIDTLICQVTRPRETVPYLVVIKSYSKVGVEPLFSNLFADSTWGKCEGDIKFLKKLWIEFMHGDFDINQILLESTRRCFPSENEVPDAEPIVYKMTIQDFEHTPMYSALFVKCDVTLGGLKL